MDHKNLNLLKEVNMKKIDITEKDKERIIGFINEGLTTTQIIKKMRSKYSHQQIAATRAWVTMNSDPKKYRKKKSEMTENHKFKIVGYIKKGLKTPEIIKKMKNAFSRQQIAALRAHVTMGTY